MPCPLATVTLLFASQTNWILRTSITHNIQNIDSISKLERITSKTFTFQEIREKITNSQNLPYIQMVAFLSLCSADPTEAT